MASIKLKGDTSGEITIQAPAVAGTTTLNLPATSSTLATQNALGVRNLIINGDMKIDQRNAGSSVTPANFAYTLDRWQAVQTTASKFSVQQNAGSVTPPSGHKTYLGITSLSAYSVLTGDIYSINQNIEGFNTAHLMFGTANASTFTISFWVRSSLTGTFGGSVANGANDRSYPFSYTISSADTWEQKTVTIDGDTTGTWVGATNGNGLVVRFGLGGGSTFSGTAGSWASANYYTATGATSVVGTSGATFYITGVQLEVGDTATPFEHRPYDMELARCQRYYQKSYNIDVAPATNTTVGQFDHNFLNLGNYGSVNQRFGIAMRTNPTMTAYSPAGASGTIQYWDGSATQTRTTNFTIGGSHQNFYQQDTVFNHTNITFQWTADAEL